MFAESLRNMTKDNKKAETRISYGKADAELLERIVRIEREKKISAQTFFKLAALSYIEMMDKGLKNL